jgi:methyl-accepting chemotaxis protein
MNTSSSMLGGLRARCLPLLRWRPSWRLSMRLSVAFGMVLSLLLLITVMALLRMQRIDALSTQVVEVNNQRIAVAQSMMNAVNEVSVAMMGAALVVDEADNQEQARRLAAGLGHYGAVRKQLSGLLGADAAADPALQALDKAAEAVLLRADDMRAMLEQGSTNVSNQLRARDPRVMQEEWLKHIAELVARETAAGLARHEEAKHEFEAARRLLIIVAAAAIGLSLVAVTLILRSVTGPLTLAIGHAQRIAGGDLTGEIKAGRADETGDLLAALATMQQQLRGLVGDIRASASGIALASSEIAQGNLDLSSRTERAAGDLQSTASSVEQLANMVRQSAAAAGQADTLAGAAEGAARDGGAAVGKVVQVMDEIHAGARKIAEITAVIDGIAFQTNILALNAAVEAAQAGDKGRGFAVVAGEVRGLAQRAAAAARDIKGLIDSSLASADNGARLARDAGATMVHIVTSVQRAAVTIGEVSAAASQQSAGIEQVNASIGRLDEMTQRNAALVEQSTAAAQGLQQQSNRLEELIGVFRSAHIR